MFLCLDQSINNNLFKSSYLLRYKGDENFYDQKSTDSDLANFDILLPVHKQMSLIVLFIGIYSHPSFTKTWYAVTLSHTEAVGKLLLYCINRELMYGT